MPKKWFFLFSFFFFFYLIAQPADGQELKRADIKKIREALTISPPWVDEIWIRGEEQDIAKSACAHLTYFYTFQNAFAAVGSEDNINWKDIKVMNADVALRILSEESKYLSMLLLNVFDISSDTRRDIPPCSTIIPHWDDGVVLASIFVEVLKSGHNSPQSIGMPLAVIRGKLLRDIRFTLTRLAETALQDPSAVPQFRKYLLQAVKNCKFTSRDLTIMESANWSSLLENLPSDFWK